MEIAYRSKRSGACEPEKQVFANNLNPTDHPIQFAMAKFIVLAYLYNPVCCSISSYRSRMGRTTTSVPCRTMTQLTNIDGQAKRTGRWPLSATPAWGDKRLCKVMISPSLSRTHCKPSINIYLCADDKLLHLLVSTPVSRVSDNIVVRRNAGTFQIEV